MQKNVTLRSVVLAAIVFSLLTFSGVNVCHAAVAGGVADDAKPAAAPAPPPDQIVLTNGDTISGTFVREVGGTVSFHSDILGDLSIAWKDIKEIHTRTKMAVVEPGMVPKKRGQLPANMPVGTVAVVNNMITVQPDNNQTIAPIPIANAQYIVDEATLNKQLNGHPGFFTGWNGAATAGVTLVQATQDQYSFAGAVALQRVIPTASWLDPKTRTTLGYAQSYGKITEPSYIDANGDLVPASYTKTSILHVGAEHDIYVSPRFYFLGLVSFDHNYSQSLDLQQIYGGGIGYTVVKTPIQELDVTAIVQYERQSFFNVIPPSPSEENLIASTFGLSYMRKLPRGLIFTQAANYIPAWNDTHAYSFNETNLLSFPAYKNFSFSVGTLDTYINNVPLTFPVTQRNSFQFTTGVTYNIKSNY